MTPLKTDLCIIGAHPAGVALALAAALARVPVVVVRDAGARYAADDARFALALRAAAARTTAAEAARSVHDIAGRLAMLDRMHAPERLRAAGVSIIDGGARFIDERTIETGERRISARRFVLAGGSSPVLPAIAGISETPILTTDDLSSLPDMPQRLMVLGGGATAVTLAQSYRRLGAEVTLIADETLLPGEDGEAAALLTRQLLRDGVRLHLQTHVGRIRPLTSGVTLDLTGPEGPAMLNAGQIVIAGARRPALRELNLAAAGVTLQGDTVTVDERLRTSNKRIYAVGDAAGGPFAAHGAETQAAAVFSNALLRRSIRSTPEMIARTVLTMPEIASIGVAETDTLADRNGARLYRQPLGDTVRAQIDGTSAGFVKAMADSRGRILGATIVAPNAGDLIGPWALAMAHKLPLTALAGLEAPAGAFAEASRRAASQPLAAQLTRPQTARLLRWLRMLG